MTSNTIIYPSFYFDFACIKSECKNSCCIGWEIDIDNNSYERYTKDALQFISNSNPPHFILNKDERCPYLTDNNLCELIIKKGEGYLCQICRDHPRFRNFWTGIEEIGLGLSCESAASLILSQKKPLELYSESGSLKDLVSSLPEDEKYLWNVREQLLDQAALLSDPMQARLAEYFIFRHIPNALYDGLLEQRIRFVWDCVNTVTDRWNNQDDQSFEALTETARYFSADIEYDDDLENHIASIFL